MHAICRIRSVTVLPPYSLDVTFDDGTDQRIDLEPVLYGALYGPLRDPRLFAAVTVDPEVGTVVWPNGADFDPATLHDWHENREAFGAQAQQWRQIPSA